MSLDTNSRTETAAELDPATDGRAPFRSDIQGLRALAVVLVVANHLVGWPIGGFIGVDVFFVISGFLITGLLVDGLERTGRVDLREFYARRARRILPMAVVVLVATVAAGYALLSPARAHDTLVGALYSLLFVENWHLVATGTGYWHLGDAASPVQQYWSLSVEEQFYLVWPMLLLAVWALTAAVRRRRAGAGGSSSVGDADALGGRLLRGLWQPRGDADALGGRLLRRVRQPRGVAAVAVGGLVIVLFGWACVASSNSPEAAYFATFSRGWELAAGALLALLLPWVPSVGARTRRALAAVGLVVILGSALLIGVGPGFPGPLALWPVLGAGLVIVAGSGVTAASAPGLLSAAAPGAWHSGSAAEPRAGSAGSVASPRSGILANPVSQYLGAISYSLYLWHFPVIIFLGLLLPPGPLAVALMVAVMLALSAASYRWVEQPVRHSAWLSSRRRDADPAGAGAGAGADTAAGADPWLDEPTGEHRGDRRHRSRAAYAAVAVVVVLVIGWLLLMGPGGSMRATRQTAAPALSLSVVPDASGGSPTADSAGDGASPDGAAAGSVGAAAGAGGGAAGSEGDAASSGGGGGGDTAGAATGTSGSAATSPPDPLAAPTAVVQAGLAAAHASGGWPELNMSGDWSDWSLPANAGRCETRFTEARLCVFDTPGATGTAMVVGDSMAAAWFPALRDSLLGQGYRLEVYYLVGCPAALVPIHKHSVGAPRNEECDAFREDVAARVASIGPDVTVVASAWRQQELALSGATGADLEREWRDGTLAALDRLARTSGRTVVIDAPPGAGRIQECLTAVSAPQDCERPIEALAAQAGRVNADAVAGLTALGMNVTHVDVARWFCLPAGVCPAYYSDMPVYTDGTHPSTAYAAYLSPLVSGAAFGAANAPAGPVAGN